MSSFAPRKNFPSNERPFAEQKATKRSKRRQCGAKGDKQRNSRPRHFCPAGEGRQATGRGCYNVTLVKLFFHPQEKTNKNGAIRSRHFFLSPLTFSSPGFALERRMAEAYEKSQGKRK